ncbi:SMC-Scp complex subunit ScpB [Roseimaritima sediminicola]|uniref:SMC-Scp complex subunit ScpB n=1 Tax=Roseimaritima sediminicola TaxID=2662066 RepID=UPI00192A2AE9|nr:SMC-Scp complex subunit ScpB [Roseimaritima sediminicola]
MRRSWTALGDRPGCLLRSAGRRNAPGAGAAPGARAAPGAGAESRPRRPYGVLWSAAERPAASAAAAEEDPEARRQRVEAVLLLAKGPLTARKIAQLASLEDATEARTLVRRWNELSDQWGRAMRIESIAGGYQMLTRPQYAPWLRRLGHIPAPVRLSPPALETLAIVAYRQPVMRAAVEAIRGVACGELLRQLMERDLIRISGRSEELGRPFLYSTSKRFLQIFGLHSVDALPNIRFDMLPNTLSDSGTETSDSSEESDVSIAMAPAALETDLHPAAAAETPDAESPLASADAPAPGDAPAAIIEDDEDDWDDEDDDWDDEDDDWDDDDDLDDDEDPDDEDDEDDDDLDDDDQWREVGDDDDDDLDDEDDEDDLDDDYDSLDDDDDLDEDDDWD